jgi:hypothetical protein
MITKNTGNIQFVQEDPIEEIVVVSHKYHKLSNKRKERLLNLLLDWASKEKMQINNKTIC